MPSKSVSIIFEALQYASVKHQYLRRGGYDKLPYINHLIKVANLIQQVGLGGNTDLMLVAILHDVVEDTDASPDEIAEKFGSAVATAISELSDDMSLPHDERKGRQVQNASRLSHFARMVRIADKICNIRDIVEYPVDWPLQRKLGYLDNSVEVIDRIRGTHAELEQLFDQEIGIAEQKLKKS